MGNNFGPWAQDFFSQLKDRLEEDKGRGKAKLARAYDASLAYLKTKGIKAPDMRKGSPAPVRYASWAFSAGGTRFFRFPYGGEPTSIFQKIEDASVVNLLTGMAPRVALHFPWDNTENPKELNSYAKKLELRFDAMNFEHFPRPSRSEAQLQVWKPLS